MNKTRQIINDNKDDFPEFQYYHDIIDGIEENISKMPDKAIESCKALIEGICKTILKKLKVLYSEGGRGADEPRELMNKVLNSFSQFIPHDPEFISRTTALVGRMSEIRNKRGDISHGRPSPKEEESDKELAEFIMGIADYTIYYLLNIYFNADLSSFEDVKYEDNVDFNEYLDDMYEVENIIYSKALFDQDPAAYGELLNNYLDEKEQERL
jgi:hypothetical protein